MMVRPRLPKSVQELADWYMRYVSPASLIAGVILDNLFLARRVDLLLTNALLFSYLAIAALAIIVMNLIQTGRWRTPLLLWAFPLLPVVAQFAFGGLFSAYFSLYSRSAAISVSWLFVAALVVFMIGNERFAHFYARFSVQMTVYFTVLFSFLIFFLPVVFHRIGTALFLASGAVALAGIALLLFIIFRLMPELRVKRTRVARFIAAVYLTLNVFYFIGVIPPLPLALKEAGVYHSVVRQSGGDYALMAETIPWYESFLRYNTAYHAVAGESAYVYSAIFAPSGLSVVVRHEWQHYDETSKQWETTDVVAFPINGGRDGGYRGYSIKGGITEGRWRVNVVTQGGRLIGRVSFEVVRVVQSPATKTLTR